MFFSASCKCSVPPHHSVFWQPGFPLSSEVHTPHGDPYHEDLPFSLETCYKHIVFVRGNTPWNPKGASAWPDVFRLAKNKFGDRWKNETTLSCAFFQQWSPLHTRRIAHAAVASAVVISRPCLALRPVPQVWRARGPGWISLDQRFFLSPRFVNWTFTFVFPEVHHSRFVAQHRTSAFLSDPDCTTCSDLFVVVFFEASSSFLESIKGVRCVLMAQWKPSQWTCMSAGVISLLQLRLGMVGRLRGPHDLPSTL